MSSNVTNQIERVDFDPLAKLLRQVAPSKAADLNSLLERLKPSCELDRHSERTLFQAQLTPCAIRIGVPCTCRLQAHAYVAGVFVSSFTSGNKNLGLAERRKLFAPADELLNWAVPRDLQQSLGRQPCDVSRDGLLGGLGKDLPEGVLSTLNDDERRYSQGIFCYATAFILLHELAHLDYGHTGCDGYRSIEQENQADRFALNWLLDSATNSSKNPQARRINVLLGVAVALLWLTVINVFLGPRESTTHPEGYDRLFQILGDGTDRCDEEESSMVWYLASHLLFIHMDTAGFEFDSVMMQGNPHDEINYLINLIAK